jgi:hypothetical protein
LLNEDEAPELVFEPVEILLCAVLRSVVGPACAFEWIEAQVGDVIPTARDCDSLGIPKSVKL